MQIYRDLLAWRWVGFGFLLLPNRYFASTNIPNGNSRYHHNSSRIQVQSTKERGSLPVIVVPYVSFAFRWRLFPFPEKEISLGE
ncbi:hypothetical protein L6452_08566 [Arctium lappa]|uniref:Uncharacterized protein n=1 Tax=Arctium lappa TaxID=4217 RepID=A0ACB9DI34_ARCLA|nr:hypothetical protein L6452_08566 [Arctium lappa]